MARVYKRLAKYPGLWRVDGIGPIESRGRLGTRATVYFSGLNDEGLAHPYKGSSLSGKVMKLSIHSASIKDFRTGSVWQDGKRVTIADCKTMQCTIDVSNRKIVFLNYGVNVGNGVWADSVLPESYFTMGDNRSYLSSTLYAIIPILNDPSTRWLITPVSELLSFYTGISSRLLSSVLQGQLHHYIDWGSSHLSDDCVTLHVKRPISRKEAFILARVVASANAKDMIFGIHKHLALTQANNAIHPEAAKRPLLIKADFPFSDQTTLFVSGKKMPLVNGKNTPDIWAFFAMEIHSCLHPFGFSKIIQVHDDIGSASRGRGGEPGSISPRFHPRWENDPDDDDYELDDLPADLRLGRLVIRNYTNQFPGFGDIVFDIQSSMQYQLGAAARLNLDVPVDALTVESGSAAGSAKGHLGIDLQDEPIPHIDRELTLFLDMLQHLRKATQRKRWSIVTRKAADSIIKNGEFIALFPDKIANCRSWHKISLITGESRPRQVIWAEITPGIDSFYFYLLEMELKPGETGQCTIVLYKKDFSRLEDELFKYLLYLTAIKNRWPMPQNKWKTFRQEYTANALFSQVTMHRVNHPPVPKPKTQGSDHSNTKQHINPIAWSQALLTRLEEPELLGMAFVM